jgi:glycine cleavage system H protein
MGEDLVFYMGKFAARFPSHLRYCKNHMWCKPHEGGEGTHRFGFSAYAVRLLQDVYFLDWYMQPGSCVQARQEIGAIESSKAEAALYAPLTGIVVRINEALLSDPSQINVDPYGAGWLFELQADLTETMSPEEYVQYLTEAWAHAQRLIKGQLSESG